MEDERFSAGLRSRVGFAFQNSDDQVFSPTEREMIAFGPLQLGLDREIVAERVADIVGWMELELLIDRAVPALRGSEEAGALASALVMNPDVLSSTSRPRRWIPATDRGSSELIVELNRAGTSIVMATHDLDVLGIVADRCIVFSEEHRVVAEGTPEEILGDRELLRSVNLVHEHSHWHGTSEHSHEHGHSLRPRT